MSPEHRRTCHLCEANCGLIVLREGRKVLSIKGDPNNALSRGYICPKATALQDLQDDPDRLRHPIKRDGDRWEEIGWEQAYTEIGERTRAILARDPNAGALFHGNPGAHNYGTTLNVRLLKSALGTRNVFSAATMDQMPHLVANLAMYGHSALFAIPDIDRTETMIILGANPMASNGSGWTVPDFRTRVKALQARGGKLVVIDPRRTETAKIADRHLFIRPAADAWFLVALLKAVLASPARPPLPTYVRGLEDAVVVIDRFDADVCAHVCGVSIDDIRWLAGRLLSGSAALYGRMGICVQPQGAMNAWLIALINIAAGQMDRAGGLVFTTPAIDPLQTAPGSIGRWRSRVSGYSEVMGELPVAALAEEIDTLGEGQIRALFVVAGNPVLSTPNGRRLDRALEQLDLMVSIDLYRNATSRRAHYILPPVGPLERDHYSMLLLPLAVRNFAKYSPPLFEPESGALQDWEIIRGLAAAIRGEAVQQPTPRERLDGMLRAGPYGISLAELEAHPEGMDFGPPQPGRLPERLRTPDKTINCAPPAFIAALAELAAQPQHAAGELRLIGRRHVRTNNSWLANSQRLVKGATRCTLMIHPEDAAARGVMNGAMVRVRSRTGTVRLPAEVTDDIMSGVVSIPHGWGHGLAGIALEIAQAHAGVSVNDLTDERRLDPLSGNAVFSGVPVVVEAVAE